MRYTPRLLARCAVLGLLVVSTTLARAHEATDDMVRAAKAFLDGLTPALKAKATFSLTDVERETWGFVPPAQLPRKGATIEEMSEAQRTLAHNLLKSGLSQKGYARATAIMALEKVLIELNDAVATRNPLNYFVSVFGTPEPGKPWGWRVEGHHVSINFTIIDGDHVQVTPSFWGVNPAEVRSGSQQGLRLMGEEEDLGRALVKSFTEEQRKAGVLAIAAPRDIVTGRNSRVRPLTPDGLAVANMTPEQNKQLLTLVNLYIDKFRSEIGSEALAEINRAGWDKVTFAWAGGQEKGDQHYYRIQGPTFLIEFDNTQGRGNHVHAVWRDFDGDFGRDLLKEHYEKDHAGK
jgi:hypothetical protein